MEIQYFCRLTPLGEYFLGGEKTFDFGNAKVDSKYNYFIHSEEEISQATILGMLRFVMLKKNQLLSDGWKDQSKVQEQNALIGKTGFCINENTNDLCDYGKLKRISPVLVYQGEKALVHIPLNHKIFDEENQKNRKYTPFCMKEAGYSDIGETTWLPEDFVAKDGLSYDYMLPGDKTIVEKSDIFRKQSRTRVAKNRQESEKSQDDSFFKKTYQFLEKGYSIGFYATMEEDWCKEEQIANEIVYLGQEKSAFLLTFEKKEEPDLFATWNDNTDKAYRIYYIMSDTYLKNFAEIKETLCYGIIDKKFYRFLTKKAGADYVGSREMSDRFQFVRAGSVFYVRKEREQDFVRALSMNQLQQIGFNYVIKMGD